MQITLVFSCVATINRRDVAYPICQSVCLVYCGKKVRLDLDVVWVVGRLVG